MTTEERHGVLRLEDLRLVQGRGRFIDDIRWPGMLQAVLVRSPHAHAEILDIDTRAAKAHPGVYLVWTAVDLGPVCQPVPCVFPHPSVHQARTHTPLARDVVRYVGEPVALVVAENRYVAEDAAELVEVRYRPLPAVVDLEAALRPEAPRVHADLPDNLAADGEKAYGDVAAAFRAADLIVRERLVVERGAASPIETRGVVAFPEADGTITVYDTTQTPVPTRQGLAQILGLPEEMLRVVVPDIGGAFGPKSTLFYPEEILIPLAAKALERPVKWIEDRREHFLATNQERGQIHDVALACLGDGTILGLTDDFLHDGGAYAVAGAILPIITATTLMGPYRIPAYRARYRVVYTNKTPVSPVRGAGRPQAVFVMERMLARLARELGLSPVAVRKKNLIPPEAMPYAMDITYQDEAPLVYDTGDYPKTLQLALDTIGYEQFLAKKAEAVGEGRMIGVGVACYVEGSGLGPYEGATVRITERGKVQVEAALSAQGQGQATMLAQITSEALGIRPQDVEVRLGDTAVSRYGLGTFASRTAVTAGSACHRAALAVKEELLRLAADALEVPVEELALSDGFVYARRDERRRISFAECAARKNPAWGPPPAAFRPGLEATEYFVPARSTFAHGVHAAIVEILPERLETRILRYVVVHDAGRILHREIVEGQIRGGVVQGIGWSLYERLRFDEEGQPLTTTFMDYLLPTAGEVPEIVIRHLESPTPLNPLGVKGVGEAGVIPVLACLAEALEDALGGQVFLREMPVDLDRLYAWMIETKCRRGSAGEGEGH